MTKYQMEATIVLTRMGYHTIYMYPGAEYGTVPVPGILMMYYPKQDEHVIVMPDGGLLNVNFGEMMNEYVVVKQDDAFL